MVVLCYTEATINIKSEYALPINAYCLSYDYGSLTWHIILCSIVLPSFWLWSKMSQDSEVS